MGETFGFRFKLPEEDSSSSGGNTQTGTDGGAQATGTERPPGKHPPDPGGPQQQTAEPKKTKGKRKPNED